MALTAAERMRAYRARKREAKEPPPAAGVVKVAKVRALIDELFEAKMLNGAGRRRAREIMDGWP